MPRIPVCLWLLLVMAPQMGVASVARASNACIGGCSGDMAGCVQDARNDKLVCRDSCKTSHGSAGLNACLRDCRVQGATERRACSTDAKTCATACLAAATSEPRDDSGNNAACPGQCGQALSQCLREASSGLPECLQTCPNGPGHGQCVQVCQDIAAGGMDFCKNQQKACLAGCAGATTTSTVATTSTSVSSSSTTTATSTTTSTSVQNLCGNGVIDPGEQCDTTDFDGATCPGSSTGAFLICTPQCTIDFSQCPGAPTTTSTVPQTTTSTSVPPTTTSTTVPSTTTSTTVISTTTSTTINLCGNGVIDPGEQCDMTDFGGATCPGSSTGAFLVCTPQCTIDFSGCPGATTTSTIAGTSTSTSTSVTSSTSSSTSSTLATTTSSTVVSTTTSSSVATTSSSTTSSTVATTTSSSTSSSSTTSSSTTTTVATTTTTSTAPVGTVLSFVTGAAGGTCGAVKSGGALGTTRKSLTCGGLNIGGGQSTVAEGPTPGGAETQMNVSGSAPVLMVSGRTAAQTGSNLHCSATGCVFGPYLPIASAGTSTCVQNTFLAPGVTGTVDITTGSFNGTFPLNSDVYLTANGTSPCPKCLSGMCDPGWLAGTGNPYADAGKACVAVNGAGDTYDCAPPPAAFLGPITVNLSPITTGTASKSDAGGLFCPSQANSGAFGCAGSAGAANAICPGGNAPPLIDYVEEVGAPAGSLSSTPAPGTLASVFCIPTVGGALGFLVNGAGNLPGPGSTSLPGTLAILP